MEQMGKIRKLPSLNWLREQGYKVDYDRQKQAYTIRTENGTIVGMSYYGTRIFVDTHTSAGRTLDKML